MKITQVTYDDGYALAIGNKAPWDNYQIRVPKWFWCLFTRRKRDTKV